MVGSGAARRPTDPILSSSRVLRAPRALAARGLIGTALLGLAMAPALPLRAQGWQQAPTVPTDMRDTLATISKDSKLYQIYQLYRENRDGLQKGAERVSLAEAIRRGLATSPILAATVSEIQASEWSNIAVGREWVPSLTLRTSDPGVLGYSTRTTSFQFKRDGSGPVENTIYSHGFTTNPYANLAWSFFDPSRVVRQTALSSVSNSLRNRLTFSTRELILAIQSAYTNLQEALEREKDTIELFNQAVHVYIGAHTAQRPAGEVSRLEAQAVSLLISRVNAHKQSIQAADAMARLINLEPGKLALPSEKPELLPAWTLSRMDSIQRALLRREELQANAWDVKALQSDARAIRLRALPALALSSQIKRVGGNVIAGTLTGGQSGTLTRSSGFESFVGLTFDWKVFDGGIRDAEANAKEIGRAHV